jgi:hypothetical protein
MKVTMNRQELKEVLDKVLNKPTGIADLKFNGKEKQYVRSIVYKMGAAKTGDVVEFFGATGEFYHYIKQIAPQCKILSIDTGHDFKNKAILKEKFKTLPGTMLTSYEKLAKRKDIEKIGTHWLDYCGPWGNKVEKDIKALREIIKNEGYVFVTLLLGREKFMAKGTNRQLVNEIAQKKLAMEFYKNGINVKPIFEFTYSSKPDYEGRTRLGGSSLVVFGFQTKKVEIPEINIEICTTCVKGVLCETCIEKKTKTIWNNIITK